MNAEVFALLSAMVWAVDSILVRFGARHSNVAAAAFLSYVLTAVCFWTYLFVHSSLELLALPSTLYFILSGCFQPLLARMLYYVGIARLGVSRAGPLIGTVPVFAVLLAVAFLGERPNLWIYGGTLFTVASVWLISTRRPGEAEWRVFDVIFPLAAAFFAAVGQNLRKAGLLILPNPVVAAAVGTSTSLLLFSVFLLSRGTLHLVKIHKRSLPYFGPAAFASATAQLLSFVALAAGEVSTVVPLLNMIPLFTVLFSVLFLREVEKVNLRVVLGTVLMVAGAVVIIKRQG